MDTDTATLELRQTERRTDRKPTPEALVRAVGQILSNCVGIDRARRLSEILRLIPQQLPAYYMASNRMIRGAIEDLREKGWLICNLMDDSGYFLAGTAEEYRQFRALYLSYVITIQKRIRILDRKAEERWGAGALQDRLF